MTGTQGGKRRHHSGLEGAGCGIQRWRQSGRKWLREELEEAGRLHTRVSPSISPPPPSTGCCSVPRPDSQAQLGLHQQHSLLCTSWPYPELLQALIFRGLHSTRACPQPLPHPQHSAFSTASGDQCLRSACSHGGALNFGDSLRPGLRSQQSLG